MAAETLMNTRSKRSHPVNAGLWRILLGWLGFYPTLLLVLSFLAPFTQLISFPLAGWLVGRLRQINQ